MSVSSSAVGQQDHAIEIGGFGLQDHALEIERKTGISSIRFAQAIHLRVFKQDSFFARSGKRMQAKY